MKVLPNDQMDKAPLFSTPTTPRKRSHQIFPNCPPWISFRHSLISGSFPALRSSLIANNMHSEHEGDNDGVTPESQPSSGVRELFRFFPFMALTWFILTNLPPDMVSYHCFKHFNFGSYRDAWTPPIISSALHVGPLSGHLVLISLRGNCRQVT